MKEVHVVIEAILNNTGHQIESLAEILGLTVDELIDVDPMNQRVVLKLNQFIHFLCGYELDYLS